MLQNFDEKSEEIGHSFAQLLNVGMLVGRALVAVNGNALVDEVSLQVAFLAQGFHDQLLKVLCEELEAVLVGQNHHVTGTFAIGEVIPGQCEKGGWVVPKIGIAGDDVHVRGSLAITRAFVPAMLERRSGSIILIGSMAALMGLPNVCAYSIAKSAMHGMVYSLTSEYAPHGVRVNAILPGWIESKMALDAFEADPERRNKVFGRTPMDRLGKAEEVGHAAVFLAAPAASFVTGALLTVDGGASIGF